MSIGGYEIDLLPGKTNTDFIDMRYAREEAVVITASATQAMSLRIERHAGDEGYIDEGVVVDGRARGLEDTIGARLEVVRTRIAAKYHLSGTDHPGQQHLFACIRELGDELKGGNFVRECIVEQNGAGRHNLGMADHQRRWVSRLHSTISSVLMLALANQLT